MGFFAKKLTCFSRRKRKSKPVDYSEEELDEQGMRDLESTLAQHSAFVVLKGEKLRRHEERLNQLAELFRRTAVIPVDRPVPLEHSRRRNIQALMQQRPIQSHAPGPSQSLDSAHEFARVGTDKEFISPRSSRSSIAIPESTPAEEGQQNLVVEAVQAQAGMTADTPMFTKEQQRKIRELESEQSDEVIPAALISDSIHGDSALPDTATTGSTVRLTDMNDWRNFQPLISFPDVNMPSTMKVSSFVDLQTQCMSPSGLNDIEHRPRPRRPEADLSSKDGLLFSADSYEMMHSARESSAIASSSDIDSDAGEVILSRLRENRNVRGRKFRVSRVSISPNFPVNVWDDVAPTRLHAHLVNISMDQDLTLLPVMP